MTLHHRRLALNRPLKAGIDCHYVKSVQIWSFLWSVFFLHSDWLQRDTKYLSVFSPNAGKYGPEKFRIWTNFTQCGLFYMMEDMGFALMFILVNLNSNFPVRIRVEISHLCKLFFHVIATWAIMSKQLLFIHLFIQMYLFKCI